MTSAGCAWRETDANGADARLDQTLVSIGSVDLADAQRIDASASDG
jgi:hypothetical protein